MMVFTNGTTVNSFFNFEYFFIEKHISAILFELVKVHNPQGNVISVKWIDKCNVILMHKI